MSRSAVTPVVRFGHVRDAQRGVPLPAEHVAEGAQNRVADAHARSKSVSFQILTRHGSTEDTTPYSISESRKSRAARMRSDSSGSTDCSSLAVLRGNDSSMPHV